MGSRPYKAYPSTQQQYQSYETFFEWIGGIFRPQTAEAIPLTITRPTTTQFLKDLAAAEGKTFIEEQSKDVFGYNVAASTKRNCAPCQAGYKLERVPGFPNNCYCRKQGDLGYEVGRILETVWESFVNPGVQTAEAAKDYGSNCVYYPRSTSYPQGRFCWRNKPCGKTSPVAICTHGGNCTSARARWMANYACRPTGGVGGGTGTSPGRVFNGAPGTRVAVSNPYACPYNGCTGVSKGSTCWSCRCAKLCGSRGVKQVLADGSCYCKPVSSSSSGVGNVATSQSTLNAGCSYSGCNGFTGMSRCSCRCSKICATKGGVERVATNGSCFCKGGTSSSSGTGNVPTPVSSLTSGCSYSGCNEFTGMTRCTCRCRKICANKGGVERVASNGSCYCKGSSSSGSTTTKCPYSGCTSLAKGSSCFYCRCQKLCSGKGGVKTVKSDGSCYCKGVSTSSGGCSTYLKQRCGNFCAQRPGDPYLDSKCSCFCR